MCGMPLRHNQIMLVEISDSVPADRELDHESDGSLSLKTESSSSFFMNHKTNSFLDTIRIRRMESNEYIIKK